MSDYHDEDFIVVADKKIDVDKLIGEAAEVFGRGVVTFAFSRLVFKPFLEDVSGRKVRTVPLWLTVDSLWNLLFNAPSLQAKRLRREEEDHKRFEEAIRGESAGPFA